MESARTRRWGKLVGFISESPENGPSFEQGTAPEESFDASSWCYA
jgi:hypothetical protein